MMKLPLIILVFLLNLIFSGCNNDYYKVITVTELRTEECTIYLKHVVWGLTGDNSRTYISKNRSLNDTVDEPFFRSLDFFYKLDDTCTLLILKSDTLHRSEKAQVNIVIEDDPTVDYSNYKKKGFDNILYH